MNFLKRAFLNILYKKTYNLVLLFLFIILATLILSGFAINTASRQACTAVRRELGGAVTMRSADILSGVPQDVAGKIAKLNHAQSSNYIIKAEAYAYDFKAINDPLSGYGDKIKDVKADINAIGLTQTAKLNSFSNGTNIIESGRGLTANDVNTTNIIIEKTLAAQNKLKVGSKLTLSSTKGDYLKTTCTVVGIYKNTSENAGTNGPLSENGNTIYLSYTAVQQLANSNILSYAIFYVDDPINIYSFKNEAAEIAKSAYTLDAQDAEYKRMSGSLSSLAFLTNIMVYGILIISAAILSLIVMLSLKDRKYEIGVLLSIGEKKIKIISQMVIEIIVPVIIAFSISIATGTIAAQQIGNIMLKTENQVHQSISTDNLSSNITDSGSGKDLTSVRNINVNINAEEILVLYGSGILIVLLSAITPIVFVLRYSPKKILVDAE